MGQDKVLAEAKRLYALGFAIHWLHKKSKRPIESGWTTGPRKAWPELVKTYRPGMNVGVRLGQASRVKGNFLAVIDIDVKSTDEKHGQEVFARLKDAMNGHKLPIVQSGRGNNSRHYYVTTPEPIKPFRAAQSSEKVNVLMPSVEPSKFERENLSVGELLAGWRLRPAWEISVMGEGQQVVLPPSIHPDSGKAYQWARGFEADAARGGDVVEALKPNVDKSGDSVDKSKPGPKTLDDFEVSPVELSWLPIDDRMRAMITTGEEVSDRSAMLLPIATALFRAGLTRNEVLTVLTDPATFIGKCGYDHAKTNSRKRAAAWVYKYTLAKVEKETLAEHVFSEPIEPARALAPKEVKSEQAAFDEMHDWQNDLELSNNGNIRTTLFNIVMILKNTLGPRFIARDIFAYRDYYTVKAPWGGKPGHAIEDDDLVLIKLWLAQNHGVEPPTRIVGEALTSLACDNAFDPVKEWLDKIPNWDGHGRLDGWLKRHFEAKGDPEYLSQVFRKWVTAMVVRIYEPGAKFDWMPIFEGVQGIGKSSFGRILVGDKYFLDNLSNLADKDAALGLQGIWAVEMSELASFRKNEIEIVKSFITRTVDKVRPPYGMRWKEVPRRCVFFGTTNFETYLRDDSGNRRFKPVKVGRLDFEALERDRDQLFAEAIWLYRTGFENKRTLEISGDAKLYEIEIQAEKMVGDESTLMEDRLRDFIRAEKNKPENERFPFNKFKIGNLFDVEASPFSGYSGSPPFKNWKYDARNVQFAGKALKILGAANWKSHGNKYWKIEVGG